MVREKPIIANITFKIQKFSTLHTKLRFSSSLMIGKHTCNLAVAVHDYGDSENDNSNINVYVTFNRFISESSWLVESKLKFWIVKQGEKITGRQPELEKKFSAGFDSYGWFQFIHKDLIPKECIVDDTLTLEAEIQVLEEVCPTVSFGSPSHDQSESYDKIMNAKKPGSLINNQVFSDVVFIIGPKDSKNRTKIFGHRLPMAMSSPVFAAMLFPQEGGCFTQKFDEKGRLEIEIDDPNTNETAFTSILKFIYTKEVVVDRKLIHETLYLAEKYDVENFVESLGFLVTPETVLDFIPFVFNVGERHVLYKRCEWIIHSQAQSLINTDSFLDVDDETMKTILSSDYLQINELDLFNAYLKWADHQLKKHGSKVNDENRKKIMVDLNLIRFAIMTPEEFAIGPAGTDILTSEEKISIFRYISAKISTKSLTLGSTNLRNF